jgi:hypothetical protein
VASSYRHLRFARQGCAWRGGSYADMFLMMTVLFLALAAFGLLMKRPKAAVVVEH